MMNRVCRSPWAILVGLTLFAGAPGAFAEADTDAADLQALITALAEEQRALEEVRAQREEVEAELEALRTRLDEVEAEAEASESRIRELEELPSGQGD